MPFHAIVHMRATYVPVSYMNNLIVFLCAIQSFPLHKCMYRYYVFCLLSVNKRRYSGIPAPNRQRIKARNIYIDFMLNMRVVFYLWIAF